MKRLIDMRQTFIKLIMFGKNQSQIFQAIIAEDLILKQTSK